MYKSFSVQLFASEKCIDRVMTILSLNSKAGFLPIGLNNALTYNDKELSRIVFDIVNLFFRRENEVLVYPLKCKGRFSTTIRVKEQSLKYLDTLFKLKIAKHIKETQEIFYEEGEHKLVKKISEIEESISFKLSVFMNIGVITAINLVEKVFKLKI